MSALTGVELVRRAALHAGGKVISVGITHGGRGWTYRQPGIKDKERTEHGPKERRMGPNERGWIEKTRDIFDYSKSMEETIREVGTTGGPSGARS